MVDHEMNSQTGAALLGSDHWRCVWFDELVAVFVHDSYKDAVAAHQVDFGARHFQPDRHLRASRRAGLDRRGQGSAQLCEFHGGNRVDLARPMIWLGLDYARRVVQAAPDSLEGWKSIGLIEMFRDPMGQPSPRFRLPFDPIFDLSPIRATYCAARAAAIAPRDFLTLLGLQNCYQERMLLEPLAPLLDTIVSLTPLNIAQAQQQLQVEALRGAGPGTARASGGDDLAEPGRARPDGRGSPQARQGRVGRRTPRTGLRPGRRRGRRSNGWRPYTFTSATPAGPARS